MNSLYGSTVHHLRTLNSKTFPYFNRTKNALMPPVLLFIPLARRDRRE